jgi:hypothetical protein
MLGLQLAVVTMTPGVEATMRMVLPTLVVKWYCSFSLLLLLKEYIIIY